MYINFGAFVKEPQCTNWIKRPNLSLTGWVIEIDIKIGDMVFRNQKVSRLYNVVKMVIKLL